MKIRKLLKDCGLGFRTVKSGIAVFVCLCIGYLLQGAFPVYACVTAIVTMQDTPQKSISSGKSRLIGTGVGGAVGMVFLWIDSFTNYPFIQVLLITFAVVLGLMICYMINQKDACAICAVVILAVLISHTTEDIYFYAAIRIIETALGVIVSILVNRYLWPNLEEIESLNDTKSSEVLKDVK